MQADRSRSPARCRRRAAPTAPICFRRMRGGPILQTLVRGLEPHVDHWQPKPPAPSKRPSWCGKSLTRQRSAAASVAVSPLEDEATSSGEPLLRSGQQVAEAVLPRSAWSCGCALQLCQPEVMGEAVSVARRVIEARSAVKIGVYANAFPPQPKDATAK